MPSNHDLTAEAAIRRLHANAAKQPSLEFVERLTQSLDLHRAERSPRPMPLIPEDSPTRVLTKPRHAIAFLAVALLLASSITWIGLVNDRPLDNIAATQTTRPNPRGELWSLPVPLDGAGIAGHFDSSNGVFYRGIYWVFATPQDRNKVTYEAYDGDSGTLLWSTPGALASASDTDALGLYLAIIDERRSASVILLDAETGDERWKADIPSGATYLEVVGDNLLVQDWANHVTALDRKNGKVLWQVAIGPPNGSSEQATIPLLVYGAFVVAKAPGSPLQVLDIESGAVIWSLDVGDAVQAAISNDTLAVVVPGDAASGRTAGSAQLTAYSLSHGTPLWHRDYKSRYQAVPQSLLGTRSGFAIDAKMLGPVISDRPSGVTPAEASAPAGLASTEQALGKNPPATVLFGLDPSSGATTWVADWRATSSESEGIVGADITLVAADPQTDSYFVVRQDLRAGWISPPGLWEFGLALNRRNGIDDVAIPVVQLDGPGGSAIQLSDIPPWVTLDGSIAYVTYGTGEVVAFTRGSS